MTSPRITVFLGAGLRSGDALADWVLARFGFGRMWVRCKWCQPERITGVKLCRRDRSGAITDGICPACHAAMVRQMGLEVRRSPLLPTCRAAAACMIGTLAGLAYMAGVVAYLSP